MSTAANSTLSSGQVGFGVTSRSREESTSSISFNRARQAVRDRHTITEPRVPHPPAVLEDDGSASLCSSNPGFLRCLDVGWSMPVEGRNSKCRLPPLPKLLWKRLDSTAAILPRCMADDLVHSFFTFAHDFLPVFHKPAFDRQYDKLWRSSWNSGPYDPREHLDDAIFLSTLNVCLALGSLFSQLVLDEHRESTSDEYYRRSRALMNFDVCDYSSLSTVRLQLVSGLYLQTTSNVSRCWNVVGMAIRLAQDLGLHEDPLRIPQSDQLEAEIDRRVWYSCVVMDILLVSIYGRPSTTSRTWVVELPSDVDREYNTVDPSGNMSSELMSGASMFRLSVRLLGILHEILDTVYSSSGSRLDERPGSGNAELLRQTLELNDQLDQFLASMPESLSSFVAIPPSMDHNHDCEFSLHEQALLTRVLYARIMLLRPLTLVLAKRDPSKSLNLGSTVLMECCRLCLVSAELLVFSLRPDGASPRRLADWHSVYLSFTAATVFLSVLRNPILRENDLSNRFWAFRQNCIDILESTTLNNTLVCQLESLLNFLQNVLCHNEEGFTHSIPTSTNTGDLFLHDTAGSSLDTREDDVAPVAVAASDAWDDFDIFQMLDQQFLDPSWLEDDQV